MGDVVVLHFGQGSEAARLAETCETYRVLLDDMLARLNALRGVQHLTWGVTVEIWTADARRLIDEINGNTPLVRVAQQVASRLGPLRLALEAMERQRPHDFSEANGADGFMADCRAINDEIKTRRDLREFHIGSDAPILQSVGPTDGMPGHRQAERALPIIGERAALPSLGDEACSAIFHGAEALRAAGAMLAIACAPHVERLRAAGKVLAAGSAALLARIRHLLAHVGLPHHTATLERPRLAVIRNDAPKFRPAPDGGSGGDAA